MKKILILGINGFIGHHLSKRIVETTDWEIYGMDMHNERLADLLAELDSLSGNYGEGLGAAPRRAQAIDLRRLCKQPARQRTHMPAESAETDEYTRTPYRAS